MFIKSIGSVGNSKMYAAFGIYKGREYSGLGFSFNEAISSALKQLQLLTFE